MFGRKHKEIVVGTMWLNSVQYDITTNPNSLCSVTSDMKISVATEIYSQLARGKSVVIRFNGDKKRALKPTKGKGIVTVIDSSCKYTINLEEK